MNFVESLELFHVSAKEIPCLTGRGAPTGRTDGAQGVLYMDIDTGDLYKCRGGTDGQYRWEMQGGGTAPVKGVDYYTDEDKAEMVAMVLEALGGHVLSGYVDGENNIIIMGLPEGDYTVQYEMEDGSTIEIGNLELGEPDAPAENNYFDASTALLNHRLGSGGTPAACDGMVTSDYIPVDAFAADAILVVSGVTLVNNTAYSYAKRTVWYDANKTMLSGDNAPAGPFCENIAAQPISGNASYVRVAMVLKDAAAITAADIAGLKITLM